MSKGELRTHYCGEVNKKNVGENVVVCGWANKSRDLGGLHFKDIRDKTGLLQLNFQDYNGDYYCSLESVIMAKGTVSMRPAEAVNKNMFTGEVEIKVSEFKVLSLADKDQLPFLPMGKTNTTEDFRLKYRYIDLRGEKLQNNLKLRSNVYRKFREYLYTKKFTEVETPILYKSTPEGARDYLVPSRVTPKTVYALPQSPQTLKQLLMIGGIDRYFQLAKCFRDEDLRADRQPEFSQFDLEASFVDEEFFYQLLNDVTKLLFELDDSFKLDILSYDDAIKNFGTDRPDLRFDLRHYDVTSIFEETEFKVFKESISAHGLIKGIFVPQKIKEFSRKELDGLLQVVSPYGGKGVAWFKNNSEGTSGGISKFVTPPNLKNLGGLLIGHESLFGTWLFFADTSHKVVHASADGVRRYLGSNLNLIGEKNSFCIINDFPLLEYDDQLNRFFACHHPFTSPSRSSKEDFLSGQKERLIKCKANAYDLVVNGYEVAGGSVRIHEQIVQDHMFEVLGMDEKPKTAQFGFFLEALKYGVPPHAGVAFGVDRLIMLLSKTENIRDVMAFPKTTSATDLMAQCPTAPSDGQLKELHFKWL